MSDFGKVPLTPGLFRAARQLEAAFLSRQSLGDPSFRLESSSEEDDQVLNPCCKLKDAVSRHRDAKDDWEQHHIHEYPAELAVRHRYCAQTRTWTKDEVLVKLSPESFAEGAFRKCFRMKQRVLPQGWNRSLADVALLLMPAAWIRTRNLVAKKYKAEEKELVGEVREQFRSFYINDVECQMQTKEYAHAFNLCDPPKKVDVLETYYVELTGRPGSPLFFVEAYVPGEYIKHNNNAGFVGSVAVDHVDTSFVDDVSHVRNTPQAFSHFTFHYTNGEAMVVDVQGVHDLFTDPNIHTAVGGTYGVGDGGLEGMASFFRTHMCNAVCATLGLPTFELSTVEYQALNEGWDSRSHDGTCEHVSHPDSNSYLERWSPLGHRCLPRDTQDRIESLAALLHVLPARGILPALPPKVRARIFSNCLPKPGFRGTAVGSSDLELRLVSEASDGVGEEDLLPGDIPDPSVVSAVLAAHPPTPVEKRIGEIHFEVGIAMVASYFLVALFHFTRAAVHGHEQALKTWTLIKEDSLKRATANKSESPKLRPTPLETNTDHPPSKYSAADIKKVPKKERLRLSLSDSMSRMERRSCILLNAAAEWKEHFQPTPKAVMFSPRPSKPPESSTGRLYFPEEEALLAASSPAGLGLNGTETPSLDDDDTPTSSQIPGNNSLRSLGDFRDNSYSSGRMRTFAFDLDGMLNASFEGTSSFSDEEDNGDSPHTPIPSKIIVDPQGMPAREHPNTEKSLTERQKQNQQQARKLSLREADRAVGELSKRVVDLEQQLAMEQLARADMATRYDAEVNALQRKWRADQQKKDARLAELSARLSKMAFFEQAYSDMQKQRQRDNRKLKACIAALTDSFSQMITTEAFKAVEAQRMRDKAELENRLAVMEVQLSQMCHLGAANGRGEDPSRSKRVGALEGRLVAVETRLEEVADGHHREKVDKQRLVYLEALADRLMALEEKIAKVHEEVQFKEENEGSHENTEIRLATMEAKISQMVGKRVVENWRELDKEEVRVRIAEMEKRLSQERRGVALGHAHSHSSMDLDDSAALFQRLSQLEQRLHTHEMLLSRSNVMQASNSVSTSALRYDAFEDSDVDLSSFVPTSTRPSMEDRPPWEMSKDGAPPSHLRGILRGASLRGASPHASFSPLPGSPARSRTTTSSGRTAVTMGSTGRSWSPRRSEELVDMDGSLRRGAQRHSQVFL